MKLNKNTQTVIGIGILIALFFLIFFGFTGLKTIIGLTLFFFLPFYLILRNFNLKNDETIIFSIFLGLGIFSSLVYLFGLIFNSIKIAIIVVFIVLIGIGLLINKFKSKKIVIVSS